MESVKQREVDKEIALRTFSKFESFGGWLRNSSSLAFDVFQQILPMLPPLVLHWIRVKLTHRFRKHHCHFRFELGDFSSPDGSCCACLRVGLVRVCIEMI